ncbi:hypothetical protein PIL02S_00469 [Paenibacillus illinoisensis]|uniref:Uncharacterized protein n=1 Tax=Paenibacillus illinoisensis TaxID=59845 RepID=A0A2W0CD68_9BACL|nr:hypothetical protein PIL02S_00469 [Paenibacillus illinoisensis]
MVGIQFDFLLIDLYRKGRNINDNILDMYFVRISRNDVELVHPSKLRLDACDQLERVEWLSYVVVGADTET